APALAAAILCKRIPACDPRVKRRFPDSPFVAIASFAGRPPEERKRYDPPGQSRRFEIYRVEPASGTGRPLREGMCRSWPEGGLDRPGGILAAAWRPSPHGCLARANQDGLGNSLAARPDDSAGALPRPVSRVGSGHGTAAGVDLRRILCPPAPRR